MRYLLLLLWGFGAGLVVSAAVFAVLAAVGMIPRFVWKFHIARKLTLFEEMIIWGCMTGAIVSIYPDRARVFCMQIIPDEWHMMKLLLLILYGFFAGIFVGCVAVTIAELLGSIPIFLRRVKMNKGLQWTMFSLALGKMVGSFLYFLIP